MSISNQADPSTSFHFFGEQKREINLVTRACDEWRLCNVYSIENPVFYTCSGPACDSMIETCMTLPPGFYCVQHREYWISMLLILLILKVRYCLQVWKSETLGPFGSAGKRIWCLLPAKVCWPCQSCGGHSVRDQNGTREQSEKAVTCPAVWTSLGRMGTGYWPNKIR